MLRRRQRGGDGAALGSTELVFQPGAVAPGAYEFKIGSAGSTMLLLQTILPPLLLADGPSEVALEGGTHNPFAPPFPFIEAAFLPLLRRIGFRVEAVLQNPGFYPNGGGRCWIGIEPTDRSKLERLELAARPLTPALSPVGGEGGDISRSRRGDEAESTAPVSEEAIRLLTSAATGTLSATVHLAGLPRAIAERELSVVQRRLGIAPERCAVVTAPDAFGPGNTVHIHAALDGYAEVFSGFGAPKVRSEQVAEAAVEEAETFLKSRAAVGEHLADQLLLPMALARGGTFVTAEPSNHTRTNIEVIREFLDTTISLKEVGDALWQVSIENR